MEPYNSWEVTYVLMYKKPYLREKLNMTDKEINSRLSFEHRKELREWADESATPKWLRDHI